MSGRGSDAEEPVEPTRAESASSGTEAPDLASIIGSSRLGHIDPGAAPSGRAILSAIGGVRGIIESVLPGMLFLVLYTITADVWISVLVPLGLSVLFVLVRVLTKGQSVLAFAGLIGVGVSAGIALLTGQASNNFVWGFFVNTIGVIVLAVSLGARRPLVGWLAGGLTGMPHAWRTDPAKVAIGRRATWLWIGVLGARLAVQVPLYLADATAALAATRLLMGVPLYAAALWVTWLMVRAVSEQPEASGEDATASDEE